MLLPENTVEVSGNMVYSKVVMMEIEASASGIILDSLIKIYANPYVAALREYSSNAWDSHRVAKQTRAIEVSLPSTLSPIFVVEDFGTGMSRIELGKYGQFGWSTKRNADDAEANENIGGFGLGSKVGLAFSSQYTVQAVKDGYKNTVVIGRDKNNNPQMGFINGPDFSGMNDDEQLEAELAYLGEPTDAPNGVKITIPTTETHAFREALSKNFFIGFGPEAIKIDGQFPKYSVHNTNQFVPLKGGLGWEQAKGSTHGIGTLALVQGVSYGIDWTKLDGGVDWTLRTSFLNEIVIDLENGEVEIQRSRESLTYSKRTKAVLAAKLEALVALRTRQYADEVDSAATYREALDIRRKAISFGFNHAYTWKGQPIKLFKIDRTDKNADVSFTFTDVLTGGNSNSGYKANKSVIPYWQVVSYQAEKLYNRQIHSVLVHGAQPLTQVRTRTLHVEANGAVMWAKDWADANGKRASDVLILFTSAKPSALSKEFKAMFAQVIPANMYMEKVTALRKAIAQANAAVRKASAPAKPKATEIMVRPMVIRADGGSYYNEVGISTLDLTKKYIILQIGSSTFVDNLRAALTLKRGSSLSYLANFVARLSQDYGYVFLSANKTTRVDKYVGVIPNIVEASELHTIIKDIAKGIIAKKTDIQKRAIIDAPNAGWAARLGQFDTAGIKLQSTREWVEAVRTKLNNSYSNEDAFINDLVRNGYYFDVSAADYAVTSTLESPVKRYPLLSHVSSYNVNQKDVLDYINMIDKAAGLI